MTAQPDDATSTGGWAGITDKYWLTALIPDQTTPVEGRTSAISTEHGRPLSGRFRANRGADGAPGGDVTR